METQVQILQHLLETNYWDEGFYLTELRIILGLWNW